nr:immunoglobulin heavy chain junction region [Mus musculus]
YYCSISYGYYFD